MPEIIMVNVFVRIAHPYIGHGLKGQPILSGTVHLAELSLV